jgi:hypothetical protein
MATFHGWDAVMRREELGVSIPLSEIYTLTALDPAHTLDETPEAPPTAANAAA